MPLISWPIFLRSRQHQCYQIQVWQLRCVLIEFTLNCGSLPSNWPVIIPAWPGLYMEGTVYTSYSFRKSGPLVWHGKNLANCLAWLLDGSEDLFSWRPTTIQPTPFKTLFRSFWRHAKLPIRNSKKTISQSAISQVFCSANRSPNTFFMTPVFTFPCNTN
jgi:hypothetical protein